MRLASPDSPPVLWFIALCASAVGCGPAGGSDASSFLDPSGSGGNSMTDPGAGQSGAAAGSGSNGFISVSDAAVGQTGGSSSVPPTSADAACAGEERDSTPLVVDLFIMVDKSISMNCAAADTACDNPPKGGAVPPTRWTAVTDAIKGFINAPPAPGIGAGVGFFSLPGANFCNTAAYAMPAAPIAPLPGSATAILAAITMNAPGGTTPTEPALQGSIDYAKSYTMATPGHTAAVVFVTDGLPNGCNSTVAGAATIAQNGFMGAPSIKTYVVGLGFTMNLDTIALAGSGGLQHYFPATGDVAGQLTAALKQISKPTIGCDYAIPTGGKPLDYSAVNVETKVGAAAMSGIVGKVNDASQCTAVGGWYYDTNPPATPTKITLCPQTCGPLSMTDGSGLKVLIGCASIPAGVK